MPSLSHRGAGTPVTTGTVWTNLANAVDGVPGGSTPNTYAVWTSSTSGAVATIEITGFDVTAVPDAGFTGLYFIVRHFESNATRISTVTLQSYIGATPVGTGPWTINKVTSVGQQVVVDNLTLAQAKDPNLKVRLTITRAGVTQSATFNLDHIELLVNYDPVPQTWAGSTGGVGVEGVSGTWTTTGPPPAITQAAYRFYSGGTESGSGALSAQDAPFVFDVAAHPGLCHLRILLQSTSATDIPSTDDWRLQFAVNGGAWTNLTTGSSPTHSYDGGSVTEGQVTTNRLTGGTGSFVAGKVGEDGQVDDVGWTGNNFTELLYTISLSQSLPNADVLTYRVVKNGSIADMTYAVMPAVNVVNLSQTWTGGSTGTLGVAGQSGAFVGGDVTWANGSTATVGVTGVSGTFTTTIPAQTWTGGSTADVGVAGTSGSFTPGVVTWAGSTAAVGVAGISAAFTPGGVTWAGSTATVGVAGVSGEFFQPLPQTWAGSTATIGVEGVSGSIQSVVTWAGSIAAVGVAGASGAFVPGTVTWAGSTATMGATGSSGAFTGGSVTWTGGSTAAVGVAGVTGLFVAAPVTWTGSTATIGVAGTSGVFLAGGQAWAGSTATLGVTGVSAAFVPGGMTWSGSIAALGVAGTSGTFIPGTVTWAGTAAGVGIAGISGAFSSGNQWGGSIATVGVAGISGAFVGGAVIWAGSTGTLGIAAVSGVFASHVTWVGSTATIGVTGVSGVLFSDQVWPGSTAAIGATGISGEWTQVFGLFWVGSVALISVTGISGTWGIWVRGPRPKPKRRRAKNRYLTPAKAYRLRHPQDFNYTIHMSTYVPQPDPYTDRRWRRMEAARKRAGITSLPAGKTAEEIGRNSFDIDWRWLGTRGD